MTPIDRRAQRLLSWQGRARAAGEQAKAFIEARRDLLGSHHAHPRRRELDRQGDAVQIVADLRDRRRVCLVDREVWAHLTGAVDEQADGLRLGDRLHRLRRPHWLAVRLAGKRQGGHAPGDLSRHLQRRSTGAQHGDARTASQHSFDDLAASVEQMLAVVEHTEVEQDRPGIVQQLEDTERAA